MPPQHLVLLASRFPMPGDTVWVTGNTGTQYRGLLLNSEDAYLQRLLAKADAPDDVDTGQIGSAAVQIRHRLLWCPAKTIEDVAVLAPSTDWGLPIVLDYRGQLVDLHWESVAKTATDSPELPLVVDTDGRWRRISTMTFWRFNKEIVSPLDTEASSLLRDLETAFESTASHARAVVLLTPRPRLKATVLAAEHAANPRLQVALLVSRLTSDEAAERRLSVQSGDN